MTSSTTFAKWRDNNEHDPHGDHYDQGVERLAYGHHSNEVIAQALVTGVSAMFFITWLTAGKERLRWLSRKLHSLTDDHKGINEYRATLLLGHLTDDELANTFYLSESTEDLKAGRERILWLSDRIKRNSNTKIREYP
jgi:hypothetical protein